MTWLWQFTRVIILMPLFWYVVTWLRQFTRIIILMRLSWYVVTWLWQFTRNIILMPLWLYSCPCPGMLWRGCDTFNIVSIHSQPSYTLDHVVLDIYGARVLIGTQKIIVKIYHGCKSMGNINIFEIPAHLSCPLSCKSEINIGYMYMCW